MGVRRTGRMIRSAAAGLAFLALPALVLPAYAQTTPPAQSAPVKDAMTFTLVTNDPDAPRERQQRWVAASGGFVPDTAKAFEEFLKRHPIDGGTVIYLDSRGGSILGALRFGEALRKIGASVSIGKSLAIDAGNGDRLPRHQLVPRLGRCFSACAYAFLGGLKRTVPAGAAYGVHMFWPAEHIEGHLQKTYNFREIERAQRLSAQIAAFIQKMGGDVDLLVLASRTPPKVAMRRLTPKEIVDLKVATLGEEGPVFAAPGQWGRSGEGMNTVLTTGGTATVTGKHPARYMMMLGCSTTPGFHTLRFEMTPTEQAPQGERLSLRRIVIASGDKDAVIARSGKDIRAFPAAFPTIAAARPGNWIGRIGTVMDEVFANAATRPGDGLVIRIDHGAGPISEVKLPAGNLAALYRDFATGCGTSQPDEAPDTGD